MCLHTGNQSESQIMRECEDEPERKLSGWITSVVSNTKLIKMFCEVLLHGTSWKIPSDGVGSLDGRTEALYTKLVFFLHGDRIRKMA